MSMPRFPPFQSKAADFSAAFLSLRRLRYRIVGITAPAGATAIRQQTVLPRVIPIGRIRRGGIATTTTTVCRRTARFRRGRVIPAEGYAGKASVSIGIAIRSVLTTAVVLTDVLATATVLRYADIATAIATDALTTAIPKAIPATTAAIITIIAHSRIFVLLVYLRETSYYTICKRYFFRSHMLKTDEFFVRFFLTPSYLL